MPWPSETPNRAAFQAMAEAVGAGGVLLNSKPDAFARIRAKLAASRLSSTAVARIGLQGDSLTRGTGSGTATTSDAKQGIGGIAHQMAKVLVGRGINATAEGLFGYGGWQGTGPGTYDDYDDRVVLNGSFDGNEFSSVVSWGGNAFRATAAGYMQFTPSVSADTIDIYYLDNGAGWNYQIDGAGAVTPTLGNTALIKKLTVSLATVASHAFRINWASGTVYIVGAIAYTAGAGRVEIHNGGWHGSRTQQWVDGSAGSFWNFDRYAGVAGLDLVIFGLGGTNDWGNSVTPATYIANVDTLVDKLAALAAPPDILLLTAPPDGRATGLAADQQSYVDAMIDYAFANGLPVYDRWRSWGTAAAMKTNSAMTTDDVHLTRFGYMADAEKMVGCILGR